jgi:hypothetical protein
MATLAELESGNPNIRQQLLDWRQARQQKEEDGFDYQAFRQHVLAIGAPDPGEEEFDEFWSADRSPLGRSPHAE